MTREDLRKTFTRKQLDWLSKNGIKPVGNTEDEVLANYARALWDNKVWDGKNGAVVLKKLIQKPGKVFDLQGIAEAAGFSDYTNEDGSKTTAAEQLLDAYGDSNINKSTRDLWRTGVYDEYGEGSWKKAEKVIQSGMHDRMMRDIVKKREDIVNGDADEFPWYQNLAFKAVSPLQSLFTPRRKKAVLEGRDPTWKETVGDIGESALYALPAGKIGQGAKFLARNAPGVVQKASKILGNLAAQAAAPTAVIGMDQVLGNKDYTWDEALVDAGIGTATNLGVGKGMARILGPAYQIGMGKVRGKLPQGVVDFLEGTLPVKERAKEKVAEAQAKLVDHYRETVGNFIRRIAKGERPAMLNTSELSKIKDIVELNDFIRSGNGKNLSDALTSTIKTNQQGVKAVVDNIGKEPLWQLDTQTLDELKKPFEESFTKILENTPYTQQTEAVKRAITADPELLSLFYKNTPREAFDEVASNTLKTWGVNKYGSDKDAGIVLSTVGGKVKEMRDEQKKTKAKKQRSADASKVLQGAARTDEIGNIIGMNPELTPEDQKWLKAIENNPGMVMGYGEGSNPAFKNWMLLRGSDLLKGTSLYRPAFEVKE